MLKAIMSAIAPIADNTRTERSREQTTRSQSQGMRSYASVAREPIEPHPPMKHWNKTQRNRIPTLTEMYRPERHTFQAEELVDLYFFINLEVNLDVIRRALINEIFQVRQDTVLNFH